MLMTRRTSLLAAAATALAGAFAPSAGADDWATWRGGAARTGTATEVAPPPLTLAWTAQLPGRFRASPVVVGARCFAASEEGTVYALSTADGLVLWSFRTGGSIQATPAVDGASVYVGSTDGTLYALRIDTGALLWSAFHGGEQISSPLVLEDRIVIAVGHPSYDVRAYAKSDGRLLWAFTGNQISHSSCTLYRDGAFQAIVVGNNGATWYVIDPVAGPDVGGKPLWSYTVVGQNRNSTAAAASTGGQVVICPGVYDRKVYVLDVINKALIRSFMPTLPGGGTPAKASAKAGTGGGDDGASLPPDPLAILNALPPEIQQGLRTEKDPAARETWLKMAEPYIGNDIEGLRNALAGFDAPAGGTGGRAKPADVAPGPRFSHSPTGVVETSSPVFAGGKVYVVQRDKGNLGDVFAVYTCDAATGASEGAYVSAMINYGSPGYAASPVLSGTTLYVALGAQLAAFDTANVSAGPAFSVTLPAKSYASPAVSNGYLYVGTDGGHVLSYRSGNGPPGAPVVLTPSGGANVQNHFPTLAWSGAVDPDPADTPATLVSSVEYATQPDLDGGAGVVHRDLAAGVASLALDAFIPSNTRIFWRVRVRDASGAQSLWTPVQDFWVYYDPVPPDPPADLSALAFDGFVQLAWTASASPDVVGYNVYVKEASRSFAQAAVTKLGVATSTTVGNLVNNTTYDFMVTSVDAAGNESAGVVVSATPRPEISVNGGGNFVSIQQALDAALPGDTVILAPKTFNVAGGLNVKGGVSLLGAGPHLTRLDGQGAAVVVRVTGTPADGRVKIEQLTVTGGGTGIDTGRADVLLRNLQVVKLTGDGIVTAAQGTVEGVSLTVADNLGNGLDIRTQLASFRGMIVSGNGQFGIVGPKGISVAHSDFFGNVRGPATGAVLISAPPGGADPGNLAVSVDFQDPANYDYREKLGAATVDAGDPADPFALEPEPNGGRINQGAFGNTPYATKSLVPIKGGDGGAVAPTAGGPPAAAGAGGSSGGKGPCFAEGAPAGPGPLAMPLLLLVVSGLAAEFLLRRNCARRPC